jgi:hypothetical protein
MESGDGGWICGEPAQPDGDGDEDSWPATVAGPAAGKRWGHGGIPGFSAWVATAVAMVGGPASMAGGVLPGCNRQRGSMAGAPSGRARWGAAGRISG